MKEYYKNPEKSVETIKKGWLYTDDTAKMDNEGFIYPVDGKKEVVISYTGQKIFIQRK